MELFRLFGKIAVDNDEANKSIDETVGNADEAGSSLGKLGNIALKAGELIVKGMIAGGVAVAALSKSAIGAYAEYEQLVGGVETLFKESASVIQGYANQAYITAGLSANEYMSTVTSFSASLISGLGGDTAKAAEIANMAIIDMADNANKMGTAMSDIQNAYQGFAKQNYTMLDNLKLGYGGTQAEMVRLINDSGILNETISSMDGITFDQMIMAIHAVQENLDITGTTAKEAASTLEGSLNTMKAAWGNLQVAMADDSLNFNMFLDNFVNSVAQYGSNLIPRIKIVLDGVVKMVSMLGPQISAALPGVIQSLLPSLISATVALISALAGMLPGLISGLASVIPMFVDGILQIAEAIIAALPAVIDAIAAALSNPGAVSSVMSAGYKLLEAIIRAIPQIASALLKAAPQIVKGLVTGIVQSYGSFMDACKALVDVGLKAADGVIPSLVANLTAHLVSLFHNMVESAKAKLVELGNAFKGPFNTAKSTVQGVINSIKSTISSGLSAARSAASSAANGIKTAISNAINSAKTTVSNAVNSIKNTVKNIFNGIKPKLNLSLPKVTVSGGQAPWGIGGMGKLPSFHVSWNRLGAIFNQPTIFDTPLGLQGVGEAGAEAVAPISELMSYVQTAVDHGSMSRRMDALEGAMMSNMDKIVDLLGEYLPQGRSIVLDSGALVGATAPMMDRQLGRMARKAGR